MKRFICLCIGYCICWHAAAQQDAQFSQYIFNGIYINPAYAGYRQELNAHAFYRNQWVGVAGAPQTMSMAIDGSLNDNRVGLALQVAYDKIGAQSMLSMYGNYAYRFPLNEEDATLALGIGAGIIQPGLDGSLLTTTTAEPGVNGGKQTITLLDARAGIYYSNTRFFVGASVDNITAQHLDNKKPSTFTVPTPKPHIYLTAGALLDMGNDIYLKPSFLLKDDTGGPTNIDLNSFVLLNRMLWVGVSYRTAVTIYPKNNLQSDLTKRSAAVGMIELYATPQLRIGYAYDYTLNRYRSYNNGTHEISVGYYVKKEGDSKSRKQMRCFSF
ncbi:type IX secretion system membrane protein, PorP/SprF family [Filimonas lacunae]|uniref:Type IX secretion system membrane protein, PorP/SprF family n=1 Tax=Filimonas lacunae TaxID=477680 RepID=A0A173MKW5_9BACT|nr:type IX secretion system membrane protein PorP/SprF [Filimonas lacunae]BAV08130.1 hypothetical protein FLA_4163 [Filimonas lacunae]SIT09726.1 type IX secretion system membrane protein, PorP/SprF family [Filimonas lacunae]